MRKYQPSNGTEGDIFMESFCAKCKHCGGDPGYPEDGFDCDILDNSLIYDVDDKEYPEEWTYDKDGKPTCTKYEYHDWSKGKPEEKDPINPNQLKLLK